MRIVIDFAILFKNQKFQEDPLPIHWAKIGIGGSINHDVPLRSAP